jgi:hypothetical protein
MRDGRAVRTAATKVWKILGLRKKMTIDQISVLENLFLINETVRLSQIFPDLSLAVLGDSNGLGAKKFGRSAL